MTFVTQERFHSILSHRSSESAPPSKRTCIPQFEPMTAEDEPRDGDAAGPDPRKGSRARVAAGGIDVPTEPRPFHHDIDDDD